ncbi:hypothetical protein FG386_003309 [Cryptosporidium ryanae]|uniref:uncharacterized protein n=1 Tax=Cryptosporidium ryanae TaxID=515981 RepID=UPI00351A78A4|nr:hypothetical protein FG386_003309 [Cryptosporidium ryanae]
MTISAVRQFSHLLLEENEEYIGDFSCICTSNIRKRINGQNFKGRMRIGSKSVIIEPYDTSMNLLKVFFAHITGIKVEKVNRMMTINCRSLRLISVQVIEGKSRTVVPSEVLSSGESFDSGVSKKDFRDTKESEPEFELCVKVSEDKGLELMDLCLELYESCKNGGKLSQSKNELEERCLLINKWLARLYDNEVLNVEYEFLLDHRDKFLLEKPLIVNRIKPFSKLRGVLHILLSGICFKFLPNFSNKRFKRIPLTSVWFIFKRVYSTRANSIEIIYEKETKRSTSVKVSTKKNNWRSIFIEFQTNSDREHFVSFLQSFLIRNKEKGIISDGSISYASCECCFNSNTPSCLPMLYIDPLYAGQSLCFRKHMQNLWINGAISTYHYIDYLNGIGGRSRGDLTQYPVFPWTVVNFDDDSSLGENIQEFDSESNYRDLSKSLGSINENNLEILKKRMRDLPLKEQFLYGSHYSNPGYISYFLIRKHPEYQLKLHCGDFDVWNRMFHSVSDTWRTVLEGKTTYMELIPQFYEQDPDFLLNDSLSIRTSQGRLLNVQIPNWETSASSIGLKIYSSLDNIKTMVATERQKAEAFLRLMRYSLEGKVVSEGINEWIDLIFGYKQRGKEAIEYNNLFHPITYINSSIYLQKEPDFNSILNGNIETDLAIKSQVEEFGQVPMQLFTDPHPKRNCKYIDHNYIVSQLDGTCSNSPWFVLLKNNPGLIRSEFDFNIELNNCITLVSGNGGNCAIGTADHDAVGECKTNYTLSHDKERGIDKLIQETKGLANLKILSEYDVFNYESKMATHVGSECGREGYERTEQERSERSRVEEDPSNNKLVINFDKSHVLNIKNSQTVTKGIHSYDAIGPNKDEFFRTVDGFLVQRNGGQPEGSLLVSASESRDFTLLCTLVERSAYLTFYIKRNGDEKQLFKRIYSGNLVDVNKSLDENVITSMNVLLCQASKCSDDGVKRSFVYLTMAALSGDVYYLKYKLLRKTGDKEGNDTYLMVLRDEKIIQNSMDSGIKFIFSIDYGVCSVVSVVSSNGLLLLCKNCNEEDDFKKTTWFPLIDIPMKNNRLNAVLEFGLRQETKNVAFDPLKESDGPNTNIGSTGREFRGHYFQSVSDNKEGGDSDKRRSRHTKITKDVDTEGFRLSCILENTSGKRVFWHFDESGVSCVDLFEQLLLNLLITKYEYGNSVIKQIQNSKSISWIKLNARGNEKKDFIVYFGKIDSQYAGVGDEDELEIGTTIIIVWTCSSNRDVGIQRVLVVSGFEVDEDFNSCAAWNTRKKGVVLVGTMAKYSGDIDNKDGERGVYFISQNLWDSTEVKDASNPSVVSVNAENNPNFHALISLRSNNKDKLFIKCTKNNVILHGNDNEESLFILNVI